MTRKHFVIHTDDIAAFLNTQGITSTDFWYTIEGSGGTVNLYYFN